MEMRKLNKKDRETVLNYLKQEPEINLFMISDIENYGFDSPEIQEIWAEFDINSNDYNAVVLRYYSHYIFYTHNKEFDYKNSPIISLLQKALTIGAAGELSSKGEIMDKLALALNTKGNFERKTRYYMKCDKINTAFTIQHIDKVKWCEPNEVDFVCDLIDNRIDEFTPTRNREALRRGIKEGKEKIAFVKDENSKKALATSQITAENSVSAMIIGVATDPEYRKQGYASACIYTVTKYLIDKGKSACLFFDNPKAGRIYKKLGYIEIDRWDQLDYVESSITITDD